MAPRTGEENPGIKRMRLRYAGSCADCGTKIAKGEWADYDPAARAVHCVDHGDASEPPDGGASSAPDTADELPRLLKVRYAGSCTLCGADLPKGADAFWVKHSRVLVCPACTSLEVAAGLGNASGTSAGRVADGAARAHAERLLAAYPMLGAHLLENAKPTAAMHRWDRGADGERVVGRVLDRKVAAGEIVVLHDRRIPGRGGNIDHLVVGPRRITVIDAKHYRGHKVRTPKQGGERWLEIDGEPAQHLIDGVAAQRRAVEDAVGQELAGSVDAILAFVGADLGIGGQWSSGGVWCMTPKEAVLRASITFVLGSWPYKFDSDRRTEIGERLARAFPLA